MVAVIHAVTGDTIAIFEDVGLSGKVVKQSLAVQLGIPRFRLRVLDNQWPVDDNQTLTSPVVQLVILGFEPRDREIDQDLMAACRRNDATLLEEALNRPRNPNFEDANGSTRQPCVEICNACCYF